MRAQDEARRALEGLGLSLNLDKTAVRSFADGFSYLGFLFCRSVALESIRGPRPGLDEVGEPVIPSASWLAGVPLEKVRMRMRRGSAPKAGAEPMAIISPLAAGRLPVYVTDPAGSVELRDEQLRVDGPTAGRHAFPIREISHVVLLGQSRMTVPLLLALARLGVPTYFCRRTGQLYAEIGSHQPNWPVWENQAAKAADGAACLGFARGIVQAKLHNAATIAMRLKLAGASELGEDVRSLERGCLEQDDIAAVRGLEGRGAALFFGVLKANLDPAWGFDGRRKHPSPDPINALLSFAYTMLYNHISTAIYSQGLHPRIGLFHERRGTYHALACDLQEEFRFLADAQVIGMVHRAEVGLDDFARPEAPGQPCVILPESRKRFIHAFEQRLLTDFTPPGRSEPLHYLAFIAHQASQFKAFVEGKSLYEPLRVHA